jgi:hypothetical protein
MERKPETTLLIPKGTEINYALHEDGPSLIAQAELTGIVLGYFPGAIQVVIPELLEEFSRNFYTQELTIKDEVFYIHQPT